MPRLIIKLASTHGKIDDCIRGYYSAVNIISVATILYLLPVHLGAVPDNAPYPELPAPQTHMLVTPYHENYG